MMSRRGPLPWLNPGLVAGALAPLASILVRARSGGLGANPIAEALNELGLSALILLVGSLACTPLRRLTGWKWPARVRRTLGLLAFLYATLHVTVYAALDQGFDFRAIAADVSERRFIFAGFAAFVLLVPLALTSTRASVRRLGYVAWSRLHTLVYPAALLASIHFIWRVKKDLREPLAYAAVLAALLLVRAVVVLRRPARPGQPSQGAVSL
jgi:sulfoxide reductase heme-binding subunit YedZ